MLLRRNPVATRIDPATLSTTAVARSAPSTDVDGTRTPTVLVAPGTAATMTLPNGTQQAMSGPLDLRVTEFTVGPRGTDAMPAALPATSGYTYAAEFEIDQAAAAGATNVTFDRPMISYTENFIDAPVGSAVPHGAYDREAGAWKAERDGRVIEVVGVSGGVAQIDVTGDGTADSGTALDTLGVDSGELARIGQIYPVGQELWRVPITHFTPHDFNWSTGPPPGWEGPPGSPEAPPRGGGPCGRNGFSQLGCERQTVTEQRAITGTDLALVHASNRTGGFKADRVFRQRITGDALPPGLVMAVLRTQVAGRTITRSWCAADRTINADEAADCADMEDLTPDLVTTVEWDGADGFGREVFGRRRARVSLEYYLRVEYRAAAPGEGPAFGQAAGGTAFPFRAGCSLGSAIGGTGLVRACLARTTSTSERFLGAWANDPAGLGGWTLDAHHGYDAGSGTLSRGDGSDVDSGELAPALRRIAGGAGGDTAFAPGTPALEITNLGVSDVAVAPDGTVWAVRTACSNTTGDRGGLYRLEPAGTFTKVAAPQSCSGQLPDGDGGPAASAHLGNLAANAELAIGADGSVFISVVAGTPTQRGYIRRVAPNGTLSTVAGTQFAGTPGVAEKGDGGPASAAKLFPVSALAVGPDGSVYFGESPSAGGVPVVRRIDPGGTIDRVAGGGALAANDDRIARDANLEAANSLAVTSDGRLFIAVGITQGSVYVLNPDGRLRFVMRPMSLSGVVPGDLARTAGDEPRDIAVDPVTDLLLVRVQAKPVSGTQVADTIVRVGPDNVMVPVAGRRPSTGECQDLATTKADGTLVTAACLSPSRETFAVGPDGRLVIADFRSLYETVPLLPASARGAGVVSPDGDELYEFDADGRHLRTRHPVTGVVLRTFGYDSENRLSTVADRDGDVTTVMRDDSGVPTAIVAPDGASTTLATGPEGRLASITDPAGGLFSATYRPGGLIATATRAEGGVSSFDYDDLGRVTEAENPSGLVVELTRTELDRGHEVVLRENAAPTSIAFRLLRLNNGDLEARRTLESGAAETVTQSTNGTQTTARVSGDVIRQTFRPDPIFGMAAPFASQTVERSPAGLERSTVVTRSVDQTPQRVLLSRAQTTSVNGRATQELYDATLRRATITDAAGHAAIRDFDELGRPTREALDGLDERLLSYDGEGHLASIVQGAQSATYTHDARGRAETVTDAIGAQLLYTYDGADRVRTLTRPGGAVTAFDYDDEGRQTAVTLPRGGVFGFGYAADGEVASLTVPGGLGQILTYDNRRRMLSRTLGSGQPLGFGYDPAQRLASVTGANTTSAITYARGDDAPATATRTGAGGTNPVTHTYTYDGGRLATTALTGAGTSALTVSLDSRFEVQSTTVTSEADALTSAVTRNGAGETTGYGPLTLERAGPGGVVSRLTATGLDSPRTHDGSGGITTRSHVIAGNAMYSLTATRGAAGRVEERRETVAAEPTHAFTYEYTPAGRLERVRDGGVQVERYTYDADGNRTSVQHGAQAAVVSVFSQGDLVTSQGGTARTYDANGRLATIGADTFTYDERGGLTAAVVGGQPVSYRYDMFGRRVERSQNGQSRRYVYGNPGNPNEVSAVRDEAGVLTRLWYDDQGLLVAMDRSGSRFYVATDQAGTPRVVTTSAGVVVKRVVRDAYGAVLSDSAPAFDVPAGFAGGIPDPVTGLTRFGARDYDSRTAAWTARDPSGFASGPGNLYAYVDGEPIDRRDPTGLAFCIGGTLYVILGAGGSICVDYDGRHGVVSSTCIEIGAGGGTGVGIGFGDIEAEGQTYFADIDVGIGNVTYSVPADCPQNLSIGASSLLGLYGVTTSAGKAEFGSNPAGEVAGLNAGAGIKVGSKKCLRHGYDPV